MPGSRGCAQAFRSAEVPPAVRRASCPPLASPFHLSRSIACPRLAPSAFSPPPRAFALPFALRPPRAGRPRDSRQDAGATFITVPLLLRWAADTDPAVLRTAGTIDGLETFEREWVRTAREKRTLSLPAAVPTADHPQVKQNDADSGWRRPIQPDHIPSRAAPSFKSAPCAPLKGPPWCPEITTVTCRS